MTITKDLVSEEKFIFNFYFIDDFLALSNANISKITDKISFQKILISL